MYRLALVEDNQNDAARFRAAFSQFCDQKGLSFQVESFENGQSFLDAFHQQYNLIFMDIMLPDSNGIDVCRTIRKTDSDVVIVFLTNMAQYAIHGYEVNAIDFILKPLKEDVFSLKLTKIISYMKRNQSMDVILESSQKKTVLHSDDIVYAEIKDHLLIVHLAEGTVSERFPINKLEDILKNSSFCRINNCYLINLKHVISVMSSEVVMKNGDHLLISRNRKKEFLCSFSEFYGGSL